MKSIFCTILSLSLLSSLSFASTYTCTSAGDWSIESHWTPSYPGLTILPGDEVIIATSGVVFTPVSSTLTINGILTLNPNSSLIISDHAILLGSLMITNGTLTIGGFFENYGVFQNGGSAGTHPAGGHFFNYSSGTLTNAGGTFHDDGILTNNGQISNSGTFIINYVQAPDGGLLINTGDIQNTGTFQNYIYGTIQNESGGHITNQQNGTFVSGGGSTFSNQAGSYVSNYGNMTISTISNDGELSNENGGTLQIGQSINNTSTFLNFGTLYLYASVNNGLGSGFINSGPVIIYNTGIFTNSGVATNNSGGSITINGIFTNIGGFNNYGSITIQNPTAKLDITYSGILYNNSGGAITSMNGIIVNNGDLVNGGTITNGGFYYGNGDFMGALFTNPNNGGIAPGNSPGCLTFDHNFLTYGYLSFELGGLTPCSQFDQIVVSDEAYLGGTLNVSLINNFVGVLNDQVSIITAATITQKFNSVSLPPNWYINYTSNAVVLTYGALLPVSLSSFTANQIDQAVELRWQTESEVNNKGFEIQRSGNRTEWTKLEFISSRLINAGTKQNYFFLDEHPINDINYYRLKQIDFDGDFSYSKVESVTIENNMISIFPNPTKGIITISGIEQPDETFLSLYNGIGKLIMHGNLTTNTFDLSQQPKGSYFVTVVNDNHITTIRLLLKE